MTDPNAEQEGLFEQLMTLLQGTFNRPSYEELLTIYRLPTPIHWAAHFMTDGSGNIGQGFQIGGNIVPDPQVIYRVPASSEAWFNRISFTSPNYPPAAPLTTGQAYIQGSSGELITFLPLAGTVIPVQITESGLAAAHLGGSETLNIVATNLPPNIPVNIELQITLVSGISQFTPRQDAPGNVLRAPDIL